MDNIGFIGELSIGKESLAAYFDSFAEDVKNKGGVVLVSPRTMSVVDKSFTLPIDWILKPFKMPKIYIDKKLYFHQKKRVLRSHRNS
jgi:hypothetical protein